MTFHPTYSRTESHGTPTHCLEPQRSQFDRFNDCLEGAGVILLTWLVIAGVGGLVWVHGFHEQDSSAQEPGGTAWLKRADGPPHNGPSSTNYLEGVEGGHSVSRGDSRE